MIGAFINHLWQSTLFGVFIGLLTLVFRSNGANIRFCLWMGASLKFLIPFPLFVVVGRYLRWENAPVFDEAPDWFLSVNQIAEPAQIIVNVPQSTQAAAAPVPSTLDIWLILVWLLGLLIVIFRYAIPWSRVRAVLKSSFPINVGTPFEAVSTDTALEPGLFGIIRPVLILPRDIAAHLEPLEFAALISHEVCHWKRRDNLWAALHMIVQSVFWFHPFVWWLGTRLVVEREQACDEAVVIAGNDPQNYATAILKACKLYLRQSSLCVAGVSGGTLKSRIERIMTGSLIRRVHFSKRCLLALVGSAVVGVPIVFGLMAFPDMRAKASNMGIDSPEARSAREKSQDEIAMKRWEQARPRKEVPIDAKLLENYVGYFKLSPMAIIRVTRDGNQLFTRLTGQGASEIYPEGDREFFLKVVPAQLTFSGEEGHSASSVTLHQNGFDRVLPRVSETEAKAIEAFFRERLTATTPVAGGEAALRHDIEARQKGEPDYDNMSPELEEAVRNQLQWVQPELQRLGTLQSISFVGVDRGNDIYHTVFLNGALEWRVVMDHASKIYGLNHKKYNMAEAVPLDSVSTLRSEVTSRPAEMEFINKTNETYNIYWINPMGDCISFGSLPPKGFKQVQTFVSHKWVVGKDEAHPIAAFNAISGLSVAAIEP